MSNKKILESAKEVFAIEAKAVADLAENLDENFCRAIERILTSSGRVIICGMGKSGIIGKKIAATLASTGTPSFFMHPGEAYHGDLGMVTPEDVFVAISNSGETDEVVKLIPFLNDNGNFLVAITGNRLSSLSKAADCHLDVRVEEEACPLQLAPSSSTTATLAMGDAIAIVLMQARDFQPENFAKFHPGGSLGRRLLSRVENEMIVDSLPLVKQSDSLIDVISAISCGQLGLAIVEDVEGYAIITDGDLRRAFEASHKDVFERRARDFMTVSPASVLKGTRVEDALLLMESKKISSLLILENTEVVGVFKK